MRVEAASRRRKRLSQRFLAEPLKGDTMRETRGLLVRGAVHRRVAGVPFQRHSGANATSRSALAPIGDHLPQGESNGVECRGGGGEERIGRISRNKCSKHSGCIGL